MRRIVFARLFNLLCAAVVLASLPPASQANDSNRIESHTSKQDASIQTGTSHRAESATSSPAEISAKTSLTVLLVSWLSAYIGLPAAEVFLILTVPLFALIGFLWANWARIRKWPLVAHSLAWVMQAPLPHSSPNEFTVLVAKLEADKEGQFENLVAQSLSELPSVRVMRLGRSIRVTGLDQRETETKALAAASDFLTQTKADILLYGTVVEVNGHGVPKLFWALSERVNWAKHLDRYPATEDNRLPQLFWEDLIEVLRLIVVTQAMTFEMQRKTFIADKVEPFVIRVASLLDHAEAAPGHWETNNLAAAKMALAVAWFAIGEQRGSDGPLLQAVKIYRDLLATYQQDKMPHEWAITQNNIGNALLTLGGRDSGTVYLKQAIAAYNNALKVFTREGAPLAWAMIKQHLGNAFTSLGERDNGTRWLEHAVREYSEALMERTRERAPRDWALTQTCLGTTFLCLGERTAGAEYFERAVASHREALTEYTREREPMYWADAQHNLGNALARLGELQADDGLLQQAVAVFQMALQERIRERTPQDWANTQQCLGNALVFLGTLRKNRVILEQGLTAYREQLKEHTRDRAPFSWADAQNCLGGALLALGQIGGDMARLEEAAIAYQEALNEFTSEQAPFDWARTQNNLGNTWLMIGQQLRDTASLEKAIQAYRSALTKRTRASLPMQWAATQTRLGTALLLLGESEKNVMRLEEARAAYQAVLTAIGQSLPSKLVQEAQVGLTRTETALCHQLKAAT